MCGFESHLGHRRESAPAWPGRSATPIATGAITPRRAVALAAVLNLVGAFLSTEVAKTISGGLIREGEDGIHITPEVIFAGLLGAVLWNMITWLLGLPSSSSHALFGGLIGAAVVGMGLHAVNFACGQGHPACRRGSARGRASCSRSRPQRPWGRSPLC